MGNRWQTHRMVAWFIRAGIFVLPIIIGLVVSYQVAVRVADGESVVGVFLWWTAVVGSAVCSAYVVDRLLSRLLPVTTLLRLSLAFPDRAPSRFSVMLRSFTTRSIGRKLAAGELDELPAERSASEELLSLLATLAAHDPPTRGHAERVRAFADLIGEELGLGEAERDKLRWGALLHDIGKVAVPAALLNKPDKLDEADWEMLRTHPARGDELISGLHDWLGDWRLTVSQHHERWDGTGYPLGLSGREIALGGRIVSVCDAFDAMTSVRAYGERLSAEQARIEIARVSGDQFDPLVVRALMRVSIGRLRAPLGIWAWIPAFTVPGALERLGKHASVVAAALFVLIGASALAADQAATEVSDPAQIEVAGISITPSDVPAGVTVGEQLAAAAGETRPPQPTSTERPALVVEAAGDDAEPVEPTEPQGTDAPAPTAGSVPAPDDPPTPPAPTTTTTAVTTTTTPPVAPTETTQTAATPIAPALSLQVGEDGFATFVVDAAGFVELADPPALGTAGIDPAGSGWYRPNPDVHGIDRFTYRSCIDDVCAVGVVSVVIDAINDAPVAVPDRGDVTSNGSITVFVLDNDFDVEGDLLSIGSVDAPPFGAVDTDGASVRFWPLGQWGMVTFHYTACDPHGACSTGIVEIDVTQAHAVGAVDDVFSVVGPRPATLDVLANDDVGPEPVTLSIVTDPSAGSVHVLGNDQLQFKAHKFTGTTTFVYQVCDASGRCTQATVTVTVE